MLPGGVWSPVHHQAALPAHTQSSPILWCRYHVTTEVIGPIQAVMDRLERQADI
jgi:hypothetical protein